MMIADLEVSYFRASATQDAPKVASSPDPLQRAALPFLKWTGGKQWMASLARTWVPIDGSFRYYEPFLGGGATFFALALGPATLSDICEELIITYRAVRDDVEDVIRVLSTYPNSLDFFLKMRASRPRVPKRIAARMIYLNKTGFNGIYRVNRKGEFNVPFGSYANPTICNTERLREASGALQGVRLRAVDFEIATTYARKGDYVYFDPPYITGHQNNGFLKYNAPLFSWDDQIRLAKLAGRLRDRGVNVLVSNSDHSDVVSLYHGFYRYRATRRSAVGGRGSHRGAVSEAVLSSAQLLGRETVLIDG